MKNIFKDALTGAAVFGVVFLMLGAFGGFAGCTSFTLEGRAEAAYGTYSIAQGAGAALIQTQGIPDDVKAKIQQASAASKPFGDALYAAILEYRKDPHTANGLDQALAAAQAAISNLDQTTKESATVSGVVP